MVTHTLRETIYIDFDKIEASTATNCNRMTGTPTSGFMDRSDLSHSPESSSSRQSASMADSAATAGRRKSLALEVENEADRMLEQAEALSMDATLEDLLDFSSD